jgi:hypothetical protein
MRPRNLSEPMVMICPHCLAENPESAHVCAKCLTPLTSHASTDPMYSINARADMLTKASYSPQRFTTVLGIWMIMGPMFAFCVGAMAITWVKAMTGEESFGSLVGISVVLALPLFISGKLIWRTTNNYFNAAPAKEEETDDWEEKEMEPADAREEEDAEGAEEREEGKDEGAETEGSK